jgi:hypothetical protein
MFIQPAIRMHKHSQHRVGVFGLHPRLLHQNSLKSLCGAQAAEEVRVLLLVLWLLKAVAAEVVVVLLKEHLLIQNLAAVNFCM